VLSFSGSVRVFVALEPCDMRKGFEGLAGLVGTEMKEQVQSGALFVFGNRRRTRLKMLYFDGTGLWLLSKRLEAGTFSWPRDTEGKKKLRLRPEALALLTDGVDLRGAKLRPWYEREEKTAGA
jgi:transposase